jgi:hypothetical protein
MSRKDSCFFENYSRPKPNTQIPPIFFFNQKTLVRLGTDSSPVAQNDKVVENSDACARLHDLTIFSLMGLCERRKLARHIKGGILSVRSSGLMVWPSSAADTGKKARIV